MARARREGPRKARARGLRFHDRDPPPHGGIHQEARFASPRARGGRPARDGPGGNRPGLPGRRWRTSRPRSGGENHFTVKRSLTDPRLFSGIGNAYSDEILWAARMSPVRLTQKMTDEEIARSPRPPRAKRSRPGASGLYSCARGTTSPRRSPPSGRAWPSTAATGSRALPAARRSSASRTRRTSRTTARSARRGASSSPTGRSHA